MKLIVINGKVNHWNAAEREKVWGFEPSGSPERSEEKLRDLGVRQGAGFLAVVGKQCRFVGRITDKGLYRSNEPVPGWERLFPLRFGFSEERRKLTKSVFSGHVRDLFEHGYGGTLFIADETAGSAGDQKIVKEVQEILEGVSPPSTAPWLGDRFAPSRLQSPEDLEDATARLFRILGLRVEQLGHRRPGKQLPNGQAFLPGAVKKYLGRINEPSFFLL